MCNNIPLVKRVYEELTEINKYKTQESEKGDKPPVMMGLANASQGTEDTENLDTLTKQLDDQTEEDNFKDENSINLGTVKKILLFWGLTVPVAMGVSLGFSKLLLIGIE